MAHTELLRVTPEAARPPSPARRLQQVLAANVREIVFALGLALVTTGLALVSLPAALIVPGILLVWLAIPPRKPQA